MEKLLQDFILCFIPIFVAMDPVGLLPTFIVLTESLDATQKKRVIVSASLTGFLVAIGFMLLGKTVLGILGITMPDFLVAGGILLFCLAVSDLMQASAISPQRRPQADEGVGAVPLGTPLIVGPGVMAASLLLVGKFAFGVVAAAMAACLVVTALVFILAPALVSLLRPSGARAASRIASIFLAAFAVMMVRTGIQQIVIGMR